jgi:tRNA(His) guanylyltransferase
MVRADGRGFRKILEDCEKPYDLKFARLMAGSTVRFFRESGLSPALGFTFSDEINLLFLDAPFSGRVEKIDSLIAGFFSGALSLGLERLLSVDCRVVPVCDAEVAEYLGERQDETWRNHVFSYGFFGLLQKGLSRAEAMETLRGMKESEIHEQVFESGINLAKTPAWQRRGILVYRQLSQVSEDWEIPVFRSQDGLELVEGIIRDARARSKQ